MVGVLEMNQKLTRKERIAKWWKVEGKIECAGALIVLVILITFWDSTLVNGIVGLTCGVWCLGKIYFRRDQAAFLLVVAALLFLQGTSELFKYIKS